MPAPTDLLPHLRRARDLMTRGPRSTTVDAVVESPTMKNPNHPTPRLGKIVENALAAGIDYAATAPVETSLLNPPSPAAQAHPVISAEIIGSVERQSARQAEVPGGSARCNGRIVLTLV